MFNAKPVSFDVPGEDMKQSGAVEADNRHPQAKITPNTMLVVAIGFVVLGYIGLRYLLE